MEWNWGVENGAQLVQQIEQARVDSVDRARAVVAQEIIDIRKGVLQVTAWLMTRWLPIDDAESFTGMGIVETQATRVGPTHYGRRRGTGSRQCCAYEKSTERDEPPPTDRTSVQ